MNKLIVMIGAAGAGKSTYIQKHMNPETDLWISRDKVRFSMISPEDEYFSKEDDVYAEFCRQISEGLKTYNVWADATHLSKKSRKLLFNTITTKPNLIEAVHLNIPVELCLDHNENRKGMERGYVPRGVIRRMCMQIQPPTLEEGFDVITVVNKDELDIAHNVQIFSIKEE